MSCTAGQTWINLHDRAVVGVVPGNGSVEVKVASAAVVTVFPVNRATTVRAVRVSVRARLVTHTPRQAVAVRDGALVLVTTVHRDKEKFCEHEREDAGLLQ